MHFFAVALHAANATVLSLTTSGDTEDSANSDPNGSKPTGQFLRKSLNCSEGRTVQTFTGQTCGRISRNFSTHAIKFMKICDCTCGSATAAPLMSCHVTGVDSSTCPHGSGPLQQMPASSALNCMCCGLLNHTSSSDTTCISNRPLSHKVVIRAASATESRGSSCNLAGRHCKILCHVGEEAQDVSDSTAA